MDPVTVRCSKKLNLRVTGFGRLHRHLTCLAELHLADQEHPVPKINIGIAQRECLTNVQSTAGDKTEQRLEYDPARRRCRTKPPRGFQQIDDLGLAVECGAWRLSW